MLAGPRGRPATPCFGSDKLLTSAGAGEIIGVAGTLISRPGGKVRIRSLGKNRRTVRKRLISA
jgi:hypothetical protein